MQFSNELYCIASAKYGVDLKDPVFSAFDKLFTDPKFELIKTFLDDDFAEFEITLNSYFDDNTTCKTIANILKLLMILNGRKAFYSKNISPYGPEDPDSSEHPITYYVDMLAKELINSGTGNINDGTSVKGYEPVNGHKIKVAVYYIIDILNSASITSETPEIVVDSHFCIFGREIDSIKVYGNEQGIGYLNPSDNRYYLDVIVRDLFSNKTYNYTELVGESKLYDEGLFILFNDEELNNLPYSLYEIIVKDTETKMKLNYNAIRDHAVAKVEDYIYELYGTNNENVRTLCYTGSDTAVIVPEHFESINDSIKEIGAFTFADTEVERIYIPDGVTKIL